MIDGDNLIHPWKYYEQVKSTIFFLLRENMFLTATDHQLSISSSNIETHTTRMARSDLTNENNQ